MSIKFFDDVTSITQKKEPFEEVTTSQRKMMKLFQKLLNLLRNAAGESKINMHSGGLRDSGINDNQLSN